MCTLQKHNIVPIVLLDIPLLKVDITQQPKLRMYARSILKKKKKHNKFEIKKISLLFRESGKV